MAYTNIYAAANDVAFQGPCLVAMWKVAQVLFEEDPETPDHQARIDWANLALQDRLKITPRQLAMQVLRNPIFSDDPFAAADSDIQAQVNLVLPTLLLIG